jgi:hypothetical protein
LMIICSGAVARGMFKCAGLRDTETAVYISEPALVTAALWFEAFCWMVGCYV